MKVNVVFTQQEMDDIADCYAYLKQYESAIVRNRNHEFDDMQPFCADIARKRRYLFELCPKAFRQPGTYKLTLKEINEEIREHERNGRVCKAPKR